MAKDVEVSEGEPHNRQTRLADAALDALKEHPDYEEERLIVFLDGEKTGAIGIAGYEDELEPLVNLFMHLRAMFAAQGKELALFGMDKKTGHG